MPKVRRERFWHLAAVLVALQATGCGGGSTEPESVALATFDRLWETFDQRYSFFVVKEVDWDTIRSSTVRASPERWARTSSGTS